MHFFRQLSANALRGGNFLHRRFSQALHGAELSQQQIFPVLAHSRAIIKNTLANALFHQQLMIRIRKPMGFVTDALKQAQTRRNPLEAAAAALGPAGKSPRVPSPGR